MPSKKKAHRRYGYAAEKFWQAVDALASGTAPIQRRIADAALFLIRLKDEDVPPELLERHHSLVERLTCTPAAGDEGTIVATARALSDEDASRLASEIVSVFLQVAPDFMP